MKYYLLLTFILIELVNFLLYSGLSEMYHPLQILADFLTLQVTGVNIN